MALAARLPEARMAEHKPGGMDIHGKPNKDSAPGQSSASDWDMNRTKPSGAPTRKPDDKPDAGEGLVGGVHGQQNPQLKR